MSCCPSVRCRNTGSGYIKPDSGKCSELDTKMADLLAARAAQDATIWAPLPAPGTTNATQQPKTHVPSTK